MAIKRIRFVFCLLMVSCASPREPIPPTMNNESNRSRIIIYQLLPRLFGNKVSVNKPYGTIAENGCGKFEDINDVALQSIKELGATHVWYTGVIEHATLTDYSAFGIPLDDADVVKGRAGSPYAIKDYYDVSPDLSTDVPKRIDAFKELVKRTHQNGLKVIIDFVPNHVARAYRSDAKPSDVTDLGINDDVTQAFNKNNNFYYLPGKSFVVPPDYDPLPGISYPTKDGKFEETPAKVTGNTTTHSPSVYDWFETIKLNYGVDLFQNGEKHFDPIPDTWMKMKDILLYWTAMGVDGFRCDMAEMVPVEFWSWVIPQIKASAPEIVFIAEIYNPDLYKPYIEQGKFDFLYDKVLLYDSLRRLTTRNGSTPEIHGIQERLSDIRNHMLHFMENHDEQRIASRFFAGDPWKGAPAMVVSATIDPGPVMIYFGQEVGEPGLGAEGFQGDDGRTSIFDYWGVPEHQKWMNNGRFDGGQLSAEQKQLRLFYNELLQLAKSPSLAVGDYHDLTLFNVEKGNFSTQCLAYIRHHQAETMLIVTSFSDEDQVIKVEIPEAVCQQLGWKPEDTFIVRDMLWREIELGLTENRRLEIHMKPYSCFIFKIK